MKARFHITYSGEIDLEQVDEKAGIESIHDLEKVVNASFPTDLLVGVTIDFKDLSIKYES